MSHCDDNDDCILYSIGDTKRRQPRHFNSVAGLVFDHDRGLLYVADAAQQCIHVFSSMDGTLLSKVTGAPTRHRWLPFQPRHLAIDTTHDRLYAIESSGNVQVLSSTTFSILANFSSDPSSDGEYSTIWRDIAIDRHRRHIWIVDSGNNWLLVVSAINHAQLFSVEPHNHELQCPSSIAVDHDRDRIVITDTGHHRVQVRSAIDGSFLFEFGREGSLPGCLTDPQGVCIDNQGRIIIADTNNRRLQAFTPRGRHISSFSCKPALPWDVAFDEHRGLIAFTADCHVRVIGPNQWLPGTFTWRTDRHHLAPESIKRVVLGLTIVRSIAVWSLLSLLPNELLFEIFAML